MKKLTNIFIILFIFSIINLSFASNSLNVTDCLIKAEVTGTNISYDIYSEWYYENSWEQEWSRATNDWYEISVEEVLTSNEYCKNNYSIWNANIIQLENDYKIWDILRWEINEFGDEFTFSTFFTNVILENSPMLWNSVIIKKYKIIFSNRLEGYLDNISDRKFESVLKKIDSLLVKYSDENFADQNKISQLIALKEIISDQRNK